MAPFSKYVNKTHFAEELNREINGSTDIIVSPSPRGHAIRYKGVNNKTPLREKKHTSPISITIGTKKSISAMTYRCNYCQWNVTIGDMSQSLTVAIRQLINTFSSDHFMHLYKLLFSEIFAIKELHFEFTRK